MRTVKFCNNNSKRPKQKIVIMEYTQVDHQGSFSNIPQLCPSFHGCTFIFKANHGWNQAVSDPWIISCMMIIHASSMDLMKLSFIKKSFLFII